MKTKYRTPAANSTYKKLAVQWLNLPVRQGNRQLLAAANRS